MASLYKRDGSPFYWIKYRDNGTVHQTSTRCRFDNGPDERRARKMEAEYTLRELEEERGALGKGWTWVPDFLKVRYSFKPVTAERYKSAWQTVHLFLTEKKIESPAHLLRSHCFDYVSWRDHPDKSKGKYKACHNTALLELRILRLIMQEAVVRGLCTGNPCVSLGIAKAPRKLKPELTDKDCELIRSKIPSVKDLTIRHMLSTSFEISRYQGCRLKETQLNPFRDVDLTRMTITFASKGGRSFITKLHPKLVPLFEQLRSEGRKLTWDTPEGRGRQWAATKWFKFLDESGIKEELGDAVCFHSNRVTVVTRLARAGVSISKAKSYVGHASSVIHETYQRLSPDDLDGCVDAVG